MRFGVNMKPKAEKVRFGPPSSPLVGEVDAVMFYSNGDQPEYRIRYWKDDKREAVWLEREAFEVIDDDT